MKILTLLLLGGALCFISVLLTLNTLHLEASGMSVSGKVIAIKESRGSNNKNMYAPVVRFNHTDTSVTFTDERKSSIQWYDIGEDVNVYYLPGNPKKARIKSFASPWLPAIISGLFGLVSIVACFKTMITRFTE